MKLFIYNLFLTISKEYKSTTLKSVEIIETCLKLISYENKEFVKMLKSQQKSATKLTKRIDNKRYTQIIFLISQYLENCSKLKDADDILNFTQSII